ncbi:MAG: HAD hydrolase-like protein [Gemmatimonadota bacterium]
MNRALLLFDIDGTLINAGGSGRAALRGAMLEVFGDTGPIETYDFHGRTDPAIVRGLLREAGWDDGRIERQSADLWPVYFERLDRELVERRAEVGALAGVAQLLAAIRHGESPRRFSTALLTGNMETGAWAKLRSCALSEFFDFGAFGSDAEQRDELPGVALARASEHTGQAFPATAAVVIGDTPYDIQCARAGGVRMLAVATGRHSVQELEECGAEFVLENLTDTGRVLRALEDALVA